MTGAITFEFVAAVAAILLAAFAFWRWLEARFKAIESKATSDASAAETRADMAVRSVDQLRLEMMRDYASVGHLEKVEARLVTSLDRLTDEVTKLREAWVASPTRRTRKEPD